MMRTSHKPRLAFKGFTLSELLVSLVVLGLIAGLTVPSIVTSVDKAKQKAVVKEAVQTISQIVNAGVLNGDFAGITDWTINSSTDPLVSYFSSKLGGISKNCLQGDTAGLCNTYMWTYNPTHFLNNHSGRWVLMNGIVLSLAGDDGSLVNLDSRHIIFTINSKPNTNSGYGKQMALVCNISDTSFIASSLGWPSAPSNTVKPGQCSNWWQQSLMTANPAIYSPTWEELYS
jgi:prepilin-type N-terminal cleavage/methylation domain-containing protein